jgi:hypothetical protein
MVSLSVLRSQQPQSDKPISHVTVLWGKLSAIKPSRPFMTPNKRIFLILGFGAFFVTLELLGFRSLNQGMDRLANGLESVLRPVGAAAEAASALSKLVRSLPASQGFQWNWHDWEELSADQTLRKSNVPKQDKHLIAAAIASQLRPNMSELEIESEDQLRKSALDTRIKLIDLNHDGVPEVVAQGVVNCSPTGNCPFWIFRRTRRGYKSLVEEYGQTFTIQKTSTNGFRDIVVSMHGSATESGLTDYRFDGDVYRETGCYNASWTVLEGENLRELKEPRIAPCTTAR